MRKGRGLRVGNGGGVGRGGGEGGVGGGGSPLGMAGSCRWVLASNRGSMSWLVLRPAVDEGGKDGWVLVLGYILGEGEAKFMMSVWMAFAYEDVDVLASDHGRLA
jgi:hypothetical protein